MSSDAVTILVSVLALVVSLAGLAVQRLTAQSSDTVAITLTLFQEFRSDALTESKRVVHEAFHKTDRPSSSVTALPDGLRSDVIAVSRYFDHVGVLVAHRMVPAEPVVGYLGGSVEHFWRILEPFVRLERVHRKDEYLEYFEMLATVTSKQDSGRVQARVRKRIEHGRI